jgi:hypothetical protein
LRLLECLLLWSSELANRRIIHIEDVCCGCTQSAGKREGDAVGKMRLVASVALNKDCHPLEMQMALADGVKTSVIGEWAKWHFASGSAVISDGLVCFGVVKEVHDEYRGVVTDFLEYPAFNRVSLMIAVCESPQPCRSHTLGSSSRNKSSDAMQTFDVAEGSMAI